MNKRYTAMLCENFECTDYNFNTETGEGREHWVVYEGSGEVDKFFGEDAQSKAEDWAAKLNDAFGFGLAVGRAENTPAFTETELVSRHGTLHAEVYQLDADVAKHLACFGCGESPDYAVVEDNGRSTTNWCSDHV